MKIAIVGAGLSGLSCAYELEKLGIEPSIFEMKSYIGDLLDYTIVSMKMYNQFNQKCTKYLKKNYGLKIQPLTSLKKITMNGPNSKTIAKGNLGYIFKKNSQENSIENQIYRNLKSKIIFDSYVDPLDISNNFDYVICATGDSFTPMKLNIFTKTFNAQIRIATIIGNFNPNEMKIWFDKEYAKNGYAYILPYNSSKAILALIVDNINQKELDYYWKKFLTEKNIQYEILVTRDHEFNVGFLNTLQKDNIFFIGNAGSLIDNFLGFGSIAAIESGILTARAIHNNLNINEVLKPQIENMKNIHELRKAINTFDNNDFDRLITFIGLPVVKQLIYKNPFLKIHNVASIAKLYNKNN